MPGRLPALGRGVVTLGDVPDIEPDDAPTAGTSETARHSTPAHPPRTTAEVPPHDTRTPHDKAAADAHVDGVE